ncbi:hypothetical protein ACL655_23820 [Klebsiella quasipneumoniae subsp. similipneumoniae]
MYIDGQFVSGRGDGWIDVLTRRPKRCCRGSGRTAEEARLAIDAAERAQPGWKRCRPLSARAGCAKLPPASVSVPMTSPG